MYRRFNYSIHLDSFKEICVFTIRCSFGQLVEVDFAIVAVGAEGHLGLRPL